MNNEVRTLWHEQRGLFRGYCADLATAFLIGTALIVGGPQRTQGSPAWNVVNANGGPVAWGSVLLLGAFLLAVSVRSSLLMTWLMRLLAVVYLTLALAWAVAVWQDPAGVASYVGTILASRCSFMHLSRGQAYREGPQWTGSTSTTRPEDSCTSAPETPRSTSGS